MEEVICIIPAFTLMARLQIYALIIANFIAWMTKDFLAHFVNHRLCFLQRFSYWRSLATQLMADVAHYAIRVGSVTSPGMLTRYLASYS